MQYLKNIIEEAAIKLGSKKALAKYLELTTSNLSNAIAGERGLSDYAQDKLEKLMGLKSGSLRAASAIITEKNPERISYWKKLVAIEEKAWRTK